MRLRYVLSLLLLVGPLSTAFAQNASDSAKALVENGFAAYLNGDASAAVKVWAKGSMLEGNPQAASLANDFRKVERAYGKPQSIDMLKQVTLSPRSQVVYFTINYETGIEYARFQAYRSTAGAWVLTHLLFNSDASQVLPASMLVE